MEAVSAAASIAGLLSVTGHVISGLVKLNDFVQSARELRIRTESLEAKVGLLSGTLAEVKAMLHTFEKTPARRNWDAWESSTVTLRSHLVRCGKDLDEWARSSTFANTSVSRRRKFLDIIQNKRLRGLADMESKLTHHRSQLILDIGTLNAASSLLGLGKLDDVQEEMQRLMESNLTSKAANERLHASMTRAADSISNPEGLRGHFSTISCAQMERFEAQHLQTQNSIAVLSNSIDSLAGSICSIANSLERLSQTFSKRGGLGNRSISSEQSGSVSNEPPRRRRRAQSAVSEIEWSCGEALGMDDYFVEGNTEGLLHCIFCLQRFSIGESREQARHIVHTHGLDTCDQGDTYSTLSSFSDHLCNCHAAQHPALEYNSVHMMRFRRFSIKIRHKRLADFVGPPMALDLATNTNQIEREMSDLLSRTLFFEQKRNHSRIHAFRDMNSAMECIAKRVFTEPDPPQLLVETLLRVAILEETLNVMFNRPFPNNWGPVPKTMAKESRSSVGRTGQRRSKAVNAGRWYLEDTDSRHLAVGGPETAVPDYSFCTECRNLATYKTFDDAASHLQRQHFRVMGLPPTKAELRALCHRFQAHLLRDTVEMENGSSVTATLSSLGGRASRLDRIYWWKTGVICESDHFLAVLRYQFFMAGRKEILQSGIDGRKPTLTLMNDVLPWGELVARGLGDEGRMEVDDGDKDDCSSIWTKSDGAVDGRDDYDIPDAVQVKRVLDSSPQPFLAGFVGSD
ncbi:hypothetical protein LZ31DRAFT_629912 [Colletotrichum somersetense]|nr:hypothetical protein LZ31DRAFT_629912 [Colletotrichum somersetense]